MYFNVDTIISTIELDKYKKCLLFIYINGNHDKISIEDRLNIDIIHD